MAMLLHVLPDNGSIKHIEGGKQRGCAVALIVMCHGTKPPFFERQTRLGSIQRLNLALFVKREHNRMGGRVYIQTDKIKEFVAKLRIVG